MKSPTPLSGSLLASELSQRTIKPLLSFFIQREGKQPFSGPLGCKQRNEDMKNGIMIMFGQLLALAILITACGTSDQGPASPIELTIEGRDTLYLPETLEAVAGLPVILTFKNADALAHDINFDNLPITEGQVILTSEVSHSQGVEELAQEASEHDIQLFATLHVHALSNKQVTVTFTPTDPGTYEFYCTIPGHREAGMVGSLFVAAP